MPDQAPASNYSLALSEGERRRYRGMAASAAQQEAADWAAAGIVAGARVADIGCGPGAVLRVIAERVGPEGAAVGVDGSAEAVELAREEIAGLPQATAEVGSAEGSGLPEGAYATVMCRHVLAHNGGREQAIVDHLAALAAPGGSVYLVDIDATAMRIRPFPPVLEEMQERYALFHQRRGNDLSIGLRLGDLLESAGLTVERYACRTPVMRVPPGMSPPAWAARDHMIAEGAATEEEVAQWGLAIEALDASPQRPWMFPASFVAIGRKP